MFNKNEEIRNLRMDNKTLIEENEQLKTENKILNDDIEELRKKLKKYKEDRDNTLTGILKDFDYAIIVDNINTKLFNAGRWEDGIKRISFEHENYVSVPTLTIEK